jgi:hypothetical protein
MNGGFHGVPCARVLEGEVGASSIDRGDEGRGDAASFPLQQRWPEAAMVAA